MNEWMGRQAGDSMNSSLRAFPSQEIQNSELPPGSHKSVRAVQNLKSFVDFPPVSLVPWARAEALTARSKPGLVVFSLNS